MWTAFRDHLDDIYTGNNILLDLEANYILTVGLK